MHGTALTSATACFAALLVFAISRAGWHFTALFALGLMLGMVLYLARFGFASTYRKLFLHGDTEGIRAQLLMLVLATALFAPVLAMGSFLGKQMVGAIAPAGLPVVTGAFMFGIGMQLGGGCGSGTLYSLGSGTLRMAITLAAFIAGSFFASLHMGWWQALPTFHMLALGDRMGWGWTAAIQIALLAALYLALPHNRTGTSAPVTTWRKLFAMPWNMTQGALALAILNFATLIVSGHPWTITWAFTLWGAKIAMLTGWDPATHAFWQGGFQQAALSRSILQDETSLMDIGIVLGALLAALLSRRLAWTWRAAPRSIAASLLGGLAMGYGARIAFGCNIGAFFSGVASLSLHGWLWIAAALAGTWIGIRLRPKFGLVN